MSRSEQTVIKKAHSPEPDTLHQRFEVYSNQTISIAKLLQSPENVMPRFTHSHPEYEFLLPHTPIPNLLNEDQPYFGEVGWIYPVHSMRSHGLKFGLSNVSHTNIAIKKEYMEDLMKKMDRQESGFNYEFQLTEDIKRYLDLLVNEFKKGKDVNVIKTEHLTALLTTAIIEAGLKPHDTRKTESRYYKGIHDITDYLNEHYAEEISVDSLAEKLNISKYYFIKIFKQATGESPVAYITKLRLSKAKYLLETTDLIMADIAASCGFNHFSSFTSQFKRYCGMSPTDYKKSVKKDHL